MEVRPANYVTVYSYALIPSYNTITFLDLVIPFINSIEEMATQKKTILGHFSNERHSF